MHNSVAASLLNTLGLTGSGMATSSLLPPSNNPQSVEKLRQDFLKSGEVTDPDIWSKYSSLVSRPTTYESMLKLWEEMSGWDLMAAALVEIVDESLQTDSNYPNAIQYECNDQNLEEELNDMLRTIGAESYLPSQVWHVAAFGNSFEKIEYAQNKGVLGLNFVHPMDVRRYWLEKNRACIGFKWTGHAADNNDAFALPDGTEIPRVGINTGNNRTEDLWYPWDFLHFRRMYRLRMTEHGEPIFDEAQGIYKKLRMAIDQMCVYRAQIQPDRYLVNVDVQEQSPRDQMATVQRWKQTLRSRLSYGGGDNNAPDDFKSFYNAMALDTVLWMARPKGFQHGIEKIPGTSQVPDVYDIELLENLFFSILGMPKWWVAGVQGQPQAPSGKSLLAQDMRFLRKVKSIRKPIIQGYEWLGYFHAILTGKDVSQLEISAAMPPIGSLEDQMKMEVLTAQTGVLAALGDVMDKFKLPREAWIDVIFKRYMNLPEDVVNIFATALPPEVEQQPMESIIGKKPMSTSKIISEIDKRIGPNNEALRARILEAFDGKKPKFVKKYKTIESVLGHSNMKTGGSVQTGNRTEFALMEDRNNSVAEVANTEGLNPYRRFIGESV